MNDEGIFFDGKFNGELFCVECYSEQDKNWGVVILKMEGTHRPIILTERREAQKSQERVEGMMKNCNVNRRVRVARYLRG